MKTIVLCFDGTGNEPGDADQEGSWLGFGEPEDNSISNVLKLHLLLGGDLQGNHAFGDQLSFYYPGVGTYGSWFERLRNSYRAPAQEDVGAIIKAGLRDLYHHYEPGDRLFLFGFSRGAAIARRFAAVLDESHAAMGWAVPPEVTFLGVFDTVAALKRPNLFDQHSKPRTEVVFENETISPLIRKALHLLSLDERRIAFMPTLMNRDPRVTEVWLAGAHSDVGGGYRYDGLSDNALQFMLDFIESDEETRLAWLMPAEIDYTHLFEGSRMLIDYEDLIIQPNPFGKSHEQSALTAIKAQFLHPRSPRVNVNDHPSVYPPTIHRSVFDRMVVDHDYDPEALTHPLKNPYTGERGEILVWEHDGRLTRYENPDVARRDSKVRPRPLRVGERVEITVFANLLFNRTGLRVGGEAGETYRFFVAEGQIWFDARVECGPDGWDRDDDSGTFLKRQFIRPLVGHKRDPDARWLEVVGTIGRNERHCFRVLEHGDDGTPFRPNGRGELFTFANDLRGKYGNNRGSIRVTVQRIS